jgi:hypothetical protein
MVPMVDQREIFYRKVYRGLVRRLWVLCVCVCVCFFFLPHCIITLTYYSGFATVTTAPLILRTVIIYPFPCWVYLANVSSYR